jgi:hypothetical protein
MATTPARIISSNSNPCLRWSSPFLTWMAATLVRTPASIATDRTVSSPLPMSTLAAVSVNPATAAISRGGRKPWLAKNASALSSPPPSHQPNSFCVP